MRILVVSLLIGLFSLTATAADKIVIAQDLAQDARHSRKEDRPIVLFVTADHCPYCEKLRQEYFKFSTTDERFILRELELDEYHEVIDFDKHSSNHRLLADRYNISLTPTVAFVGPDGSALAKPIVGVLTMDFYHYYFEKALDESILKLKQVRDSNPS